MRNQGGTTRQLLMFYLFFVLRLAERSSEYQTALDCFL